MATIVKRPKFAIYSSGDVYGRLMLTGKSYCKPYKNGSKRYVECICKCGKIVWIRFDGLKSNHATSCGCSHIDAVTTQKGLSRHPLRNVWGGMIRRCYDERCKYFKNYGEIGVSVCDEWRNDYQKFYDWAISNGWESGLELDKDMLSKIKPGKLYSPEFCSFVTHKENCLYTTSSKMIKYGEQTKNLITWCEELGLNYNLTNQRISRNKWSVERSFGIMYRKLKTV